MSQYYNLTKFSKHRFSRFLFCCFTSFAILNLVLFLYAGKVYSGLATLSWDPPTTNADGTPLTDLAGYKVYYGTVSGSYSQNINVGNITTYTVADLNNGTYYFAVTAYNTSGNESEYSNEVSKTIQPIQQYTLTLNKLGTGTGTVTSSPSGINCGSDCSEVYGAGKVVTLSASTDASSAFAGWSGSGCTGTGTCTLTMNDAKAVTATFTHPDNSAIPYSNNFGDIDTILPDIRANNEDGPITITRNSVISVSVSLNAGISAGIYADLWVAADTPFGWYYYVYPDGWYYALENLQPAYQGPLFDLIPIEVLNMTDLPSGTYTFYFGVDTVMNGQLGFDPLYYDSIIVDVT
jgi:hypothetical protein